MDSWLRRVSKISSNSTGLDAAFEELEVQLDGLLAENIPTTQVLPIPLDSPIQHFGSYTVPALTE